MDSRRDALKILGAISSSCAFPFAADELFGQQAAMPAAREARFFTADELAQLAALADLIIPPTGTAGAAAAGVPAYIDLVASSNADEGKLLRDGLQRLHRKHNFFSLGEDARVAVLTPLCEAADSGKLEMEGARFFETLKSLTADGYYTSRTGLIDELGYKGNMAMAAFPECHEH